MVGLLNHDCFLIGPCEGLIWWVWDHEIQLFKLLIDPMLPTMLLVLGPPHLRGGVIAQALEGQAAESHFLCARDFKHCKMREAVCTVLMPLQRVAFSPHRTQLAIGCTESPPCSVAYLEPIMPTYTVRFLLDSIESRTTASSEAAPLKGRCHPCGGIRASLGPLSVPSQHHKHVKAPFRRRGARVFLVWRIQVKWISEDEWV